MHRYDTAIIQLLSLLPLFVPYFSFSLPRRTLWDWVDLVDPYILPPLGLGYT